MSISKFAHKSTKKQPEQKTYSSCHTHRILTLTISTSSFTKPFLITSLTTAYSVYPNPRTQISADGFLKAINEELDIMVSFWLNSGLYWLIMEKEMRPLNGQSRQSSFSVFIRCTWSAKQWGFWGEMFRRTQNLEYVFYLHYERYEHA